MVSDQIEDLKDGFFFEPTVITNCDTSMRIVQKKCLDLSLQLKGSLMKSEAIRLANDSIYGLAGGVFTEDIAKTNRVANK